MGEACNPLFREKTVFVTLCTLVAKREKGIKIRGETCNWGARFVNLETLNRSRLKKYLEVRDKRGKGSYIKR